MERIALGGCTDFGMMLMERYSVDEINKDSIKVGCHKITVKKIKTLTKRLDW